MPDELNRFEISNHGRLKNALTNHIYKFDILRSGYCSVRTTLGNKNNKIHILIHKAVAYTFIPNPNNFREVNHRDGNKINNNVDNLEWCTSHENQKHKYDIGLFDKSKISGENNHASKLTAEDVRYIRENYIAGSSTFGSYALAKIFGVSHPTILSIVHNETWINV
jgi:hypothetical protein